MFAAMLVTILAAAAPAPVESQSPTFFALSVADLDASVKWYEDMLGLTAKRLPGNVEAKVALLTGAGLVVELVQHSKAFEVTTRVPELEKRYLAHGLYKVGFHVADLDKTVERLKKRGASFKGGTFTDDVLKAKSALLLDNAGNIIQLFQRLEP